MPYGKVSVMLFVRASGCRERSGEGSKKRKSLANSRVTGYK